MSLEGNATGTSVLRGKIKSIHIDKTLSVSGACAEAKVTGDAIRKVTTGFTEHNDNSDIHITAEERSSWNCKAPEIHAARHAIGGKDPITPEQIGAGRVNPNLLDNWYFGNPVDQRGGYVVKPGANYFNLSDGTVAGTTDKYYKVDSISTDGYANAIFTIDGTQYYTTKINYVRGYTGSGYGFDRWRRSSPDLATTLNADSLHLAWSGTGIFLQTPEDVSKFNGKTITISVLVKNVDVGTTDNTALRCRINNSWLDRPFAYIRTDGLLAVTITCPDEVTAFQFEIGANSGSLDVLAAKLELGTEQTLAHLENGNWVLNEIPNYAEELAKCQRYQVVFNSKSASGFYIGTGVANAVTTARIFVPIPVSMRAKPTIVKEGAWAVSNGIGGYDLESMSVQDSADNGVHVLISGASGLTAGQPALLRANAVGAKLILDANL